MANFESTGAINMNTTANTEWTAETMLKFVMSELTPAEFFKFVLEVNEVNKKL